MRILFTFFLALLCSLPLSARHIIGGELIYECMGEDPQQAGNHVYVFTMKVYRDCFGGGAQFDSAPNSGTVGTVTVYREDGPDSLTLFFPTINLMSPDVTRLQPDLSNPCLIAPPNICVQEGIYTFILSLPISDKSYHITYQRCCRNATITNIVRPDDTGATYTIELTPLAQQVCNNSPVFNNFPPIVICVNQFLNFDHSATDADGDQLVYEFCSPLKGGGTDGATTPGSPFSFTGVAPNPDAPPPYNGVDFVVPQYSPSQPLGGNPVIKIDPVTGRITGTPRVLGQFVVGVCVKEFRNGQLLSVLQRDFQFNVAFCEPTVTADLEGENAGQSYFFNTCGETTIFFENKSFSEQFIQTYNWEFDIPGAPLDLTTRDVTVDFPGPGVYTGRMILNRNTECTDTANIFVRIVPEIQVDFDYNYDTCRYDSVQFFNLTDTSNFLGVQMHYDFGDGFQSREFNPRHLFLDPGDYRVSLLAIDSFGCSNVTSRVIRFFPVPPLLVVAPTRFRGCPPLAVDFENLSFPVDETYLTEWDFGNGDSSLLLSPSAVYTESGVYDVALRITSPIGCVTDTVFRKWIRVDTPPAADFDFNPKQLTNFFNRVFFTDQSSEDVVNWWWDFNGQGSSTEQNPVFAFPDTGLQRVMLIVANQRTCVDTAVRLVEIVPEIRYFLPNAFTPNGDNKNDQFRGGGYFRGITNFRMTIWDRWGGLQFETNDPEQGWNGRKGNSGELLPNGVYLCLVEFEGPRGQPHKIKGFATLIR